MSAEARHVDRRGYVTVTVEAESVLSSLPSWLDLRLIVDAALREYDRQQKEERDDEPGA